MKKITVQPRKRDLICGIPVGKALELIVYGVISMFILLNVIHLVVSTAKANETRTSINSMIEEVKVENEKIELQPVLKQEIIPTSVMIVETKIETKQTPCATKIDQVLNTYPGTPWKGYGQKFVDAVTKVAGKEDCEATKWLVAIAGTESGLGKNAVNYNPVGLKGYNCSKAKCNKNGFEMFNNWDHAITTIAARLSIIY